MANKIIDSLTYGSDNYTFTIPFGICATQDQDPDKEVVCPNFTALEPGARIAVLFQEGSTASDGLTLNVNNLGPISISQSPWVQDCPHHFAWGSIVEFILIKTRYSGDWSWEPITDWATYDAVRSGAVKPPYADHADTTTGVWIPGRADSGITAQWLGVLTTQNTCLAAGAKVANTNSAYPPFLVSKTSSTESVNKYADTLLRESPGLEWNTEWYSGDWDGAAYATGEYEITNDSPFPVTIYFNLSASFASNGEFQTGSSVRRIIALDPGEVVSGELRVTNPWSSGSGELAASYPDLIIEAIGYDTTDLFS